MSIYNADNQYESLLRGEDVHMFAEKLAVMRARARAIEVSKKKVYSLYTLFG